MSSVIMASSLLFGAHYHTLGVLSACRGSTRWGRCSAASRRRDFMHRFARLWRRPMWRVASVATLFVLLLGIAAGWPVLHALNTTHAAASSGCQINSAKGDIQHVIYVQFDNTHFTRDNPNVPSDLEQMPHLLNFTEGNGTPLANHHTPLIPPTA